MRSRRRRIVFPLSLVATRPEEEKTKPCKGLIIVVLELLVYHLQVHPSVLGSLRILYPKEKDGDRSNTVLLTPFDDHHGSQRGETLRVPVDRSVRE